MNQQSHALLRSVVMMIVGMPLFFLLAMFLPAGTWAWPRGWLFVGVFVIATVAAATYLWRANPEIYVARALSHKGTKSWDRILVAILSASMLAIFPIAAFDDARYHWSQMPDWLCGVGYVMFLAGYRLAVWAEAVNKFFEPTVRIQSDRGQVVIDSGPYRFVRHPGYLSAFGILPGAALCLGSLWALVPAWIAILVLALRTRWEDQMLQVELPGYQQYAQRVRFRLIPGVW